MARLTPEELREARRQRAAEQKAEEERLAEVERLEEQKAYEREQRERVRMLREQELHNRHTQLVSFVNGIYEEVSKLSIKWPSHEASQRTVDRTNRAIREAQALLIDDNDNFVGDLQLIEPAGDMPELRDVTMTLREVKDALARMGGRHYRAWHGQ